MKKFLCILLLACVMITGCENKENESFDVKENTSSDVKENTSNEVKDNVLVINSEADTLYNYADSSVIYSLADYIAIVKIDEITGVDNYSYISNEYVLPYTYGNMTVIKSYKGNLEENKSVKFYRLGGSISYEKYYNGLTTGEKEKIDSVNKNNLNKYKYVDISVGKKVDIKENNYYLVYLKGGNVYKNEDNAYGIFGLEYGIRQVKDNNLNNIEVLNNDSLKYESISRVIK